MKIRVKYSINYTIDLDTPKTTIGELRIKLEDQFDRGVLYGRSKCEGFELISLEMIKEEKE
jgi:hypothetical protein